MKHPPWTLAAARLLKTALHCNWQILLYAVLSLTVIRMLPVFLVLAGSGISTRGKLFIGWFGPRGLASIVFAVIVLHSKLPNSGLIAITVACTIILSIIAHGITANPLVAAFTAKNTSRQIKRIEYRCESNTAAFQHQRESARTIGLQWTCFPKRIP
jgi:NhaP-type Na+/H+ or K+/H+ antiporter